MDCCRNLRQELGSSWIMTGFCFRSKMLNANDSFGEMGVARLPCFSTETILTYLVLDGKIDFAIQNHVLYIERKHKI